MKDPRESSAALVAGVLVAAPEAPIPTGGRAR